VNKNAELYSAFIIWCRNQGSRKDRRFLLWTTGQTITCYRM